MLLRDGTIKVADFGIAALENELHEADGEAIGSIHYIAPEQARGELPDPRSDIYSLGVVMFEMLTGRKPYLGDTIQEIAVKHMNADPPSILAINPSVPPELEQITFRAMCADRAKRYQSANELVADIFREQVFWMFAPHRAEKALPPNWRAGIRFPVISVPNGFGVVLRIIPGLVWISRSEYRMPESFSRSLRLIFPLSLPMCPVREPGSFESTLKSAIKRSRNFKICWKSSVPFWITFHVMLLRAVFCCIPPAL